MNVVYPQENPVTARTCNCKEINRQKITYSFSEDFHSLCMDKKYMIQAEIEACERLLKYATNDTDRAIIEKEINELTAALDFMS